LVPVSVPCYDWKDDAGEPSRKTVIIAQSKSLSGKMETPESVGAAAEPSHAETKTADTPTRIQSMKAERALDRTAFWSA